MGSGSAQLADLWKTSLKGLLPLGIAYVSNMVDPSVDTARQFCVGLVLVCAAILVAVRARVAGMEGADVLVKCEKPPDPFNPTTGPAEMETITAQEYDERAIAVFRQRLLIGSVVAGMVHAYSGYIKPLIIMPVMTVIDLCTGPLFKVHIRGMKEKRPWGTKQMNMNNMWKMVKEVQMEAKGITPKKKPKGRKQRPTKLPPQVSKKKN